MNVHIDFQIIVGGDGKPAFVVVPYQQFMRMKGKFVRGSVPNSVVKVVFELRYVESPAWNRRTNDRQAAALQRAGYVL